MAVIDLEIRSRSLLGDGQSFGEVGQYERLDGWVRFAVDPDQFDNQLIVDLARVPRAGDGRVQFGADLTIIRPVDPNKANGRLLFDVLNRGRKVAVRMFNVCRYDPVPRPGIDVGDGYLMRQGWSVAWCGWQWDVIRSDALMGLEAPIAFQDGRPIEGPVTCQFQPVEPARDHLLADRIHEPYRAADLMQPDAVLYVRDAPDAPQRVIPRTEWRFARDSADGPVPDDRYVWLESGFEPGRIYEVVYRTNTSPVVGTGLLAVRDLVSHLRATAGRSDSSTAPIQRAYGFGMSQSGRFLRHFLSLGLNRDESGRQVFDGLLIHVAGARRGEFNQRFGQPSAQHIRSFGHLFPFADDPQVDLVTGQRAGLLDRQRTRGGVPKIFATNTSAEYWRGDGSLIHTDPEGQSDLIPPAEVRQYLFAGTEHFEGFWPFSFRDVMSGSRGVYPFNALDYRPLLRAALVNLDRWVSDGVEPPANAVPRLADGTLVPHRMVIEQAGALGFPANLAPDRIAVMRRINLGPVADQGVGRFPAGLGERYPTFASAVDADGNETSGIRMPEQQVPLASYFGWNPRHPETGGQGQTIDMHGSTIPFCKDEPERLAGSDPRRSIAARYRDREHYLEMVQAVAQELVTRRLLLAEDVDRIVSGAGEKYDTLRGT